LKKINKKIENKFSGFIKNLQNLVRINTVNPYSGDSFTQGKKEGQEYLKMVLDKIGFHTIMLCVPDNIGKKMGLIIPEGRNFKNRPNLVGLYDTGRKGKTIILNGHMDTVGISGMGKDALKGPETVHIID
jgi:acetylornithine deacetylase/succinyl-diaminopimelate desuccinylase-like protein